MGEAMKRYDPDRAVDPADWTALDEGERQNLVERYHRKHRIKMPNTRMHAVFHVIVENQVALGDEIPALKTLARLMREGLIRHDAVHAIASVVAGYVFNLLKHGAKDQDVHADYYRQLEELTAEGWLNGANEELEEADPE
jgi:hypothetical protein